MQVVAAAALYFYLHSWVPRPAWDRWRRHGVAMSGGDQEELARLAEALIPNNFEGFPQAPSVADAETNASSTSRGGASSTACAGAGTSAGGGSLSGLPGPSASSMASAEGQREQDRYLPLAIVQQMMAQELPPGAKISKNAKETMQEMATEMIKFITSEAADRAQINGDRMVISGDSIRDSLRSLGVCLPPQRV